jgi:hypothetical protein
MSVPLRINDFINLLQPGQITDTGISLQKALSNIRITAMQTVPVVEITEFAVSGKTGNIPNIITNAMVSTLAAPVGTTTNNFTVDIKKITDKYKTIPTFISAYTVPTGLPPVNVSGPAVTTLATTNSRFKEIITYLNECINDFGIRLMFCVIKQNSSKTDTGTINALKTFVVSYINFVNKLLRIFRIDPNTVDPKFNLILGKMDTITSKMEITVPSPSTINIKDLNAIFVSGPASTPPQRTTPDTIIMEIGKSVNLSINAIDASKKIGLYNNESAITILKTIPAIIETLLGKNGVFTANRDFLLSLVGSFAKDETAKIYPLSNATNAFFNTLSPSNFEKNLTTAGTGILKVLIPNYTSNFSQISQKIVNKGQGASNVVLISSISTRIVKAQVGILNALIRAFKINLSADVPIQPHLKIFTSVISKSDFKLITDPSQAGGRRNKRKTRANKIKRGCRRRLTRKSKYRR